MQWGFSRRWLSSRVFEQTRVLHGQAGENCKPSRQLILGRKAASNASNLTRKKRKDRKEENKQAQQRKRHGAPWIIDRHKPAREGSSRLEGGEVGAALAWGYWGYVRGVRAKVRPSLVPPYCRPRSSSVWRGALGGSTPLLPSRAEPTAARVASLPAIPARPHAFPRVLGFALPPTRRAHPEGRNSRPRANR